MNTTDNKIILDKQNTIVSTISSLQNSLANSCAKIRWSTPSLKFLWVTHINFYIYNTLYNEAIEFTLNFFNLNWNNLYISVKTNWSQDDFFRKCAGNPILQTALPIKIQNNILYDQPIFLSYPFWNYLSSMTDIWLN